MAVRYRIFLSDIAWRKHFLRACPIFFSVIAEFVAKQSVKPSNVYLLDATNFSMQGSGTEGRVHLQLSLDAGTPVFEKITNARAPESVKNFSIRPGAVYLADRIYGTASQFAHLYAHGADFAIRVSLQSIKLYRDEVCRERIDHAELLHGDRFTKKCYFTFQNKVYDLCLIGEKLPEAKRERAEQRARYDSARKGRKLRSATVVLSHWMILARPGYYASHAEDQLMQSIAFYRKRWQIELAFKRGKTCLRLHRIRRGSFAYASAVISAWAALMLLIGFLQASCSSFLNSSLFNSFSLFALSLAFA